MPVESYPKWKETNIGGTHFPLPWLWEEGQYSSILCCVLAFAFSRDKYVTNSSSVGKKNWTIAIQPSLTGTWSWWRWAGSFRPMDTVSAFASTHHFVCLCGAHVPVWRTCACVALAMEHRWPGAGARSPTCLWGQRIWDFPGVWQQGQWANALAGDSAAAVAPARVCPVNRGDPTAVVKVWWLKWGGLLISLRLSIFQNLPLCELKELSHIVA